MIKSQSLAQYLLWVVSEDVNDLCFFLGIIFNV